MRASCGSSPGEPAVSLQAISSAAFACRSHPCNANASPPCCRHPPRQTSRRGVAYRASLLAYKVAGACGASAGAVNTSATLDAIRAATQAGADVLALAYGDFRAGAYVDGRYAAALVAAMQQGAAVAIAAGNDGYAGPWLTEGAVAAPGVISAAAAVVIGNLSGVQLGFSERLQLPGGGAATSMLRK